MLKRWSSGRLAIWLGLLIMCLPGCAPIQSWWRKDLKLGPDYRQPVTSLNDHWTDGADDRLISSPDFDTSHWWHVFNDPTLEGLVEQVYRQNLPLQVAGRRVLEARLQRAIAVGNLLPQQQEAFAQFQRTQFSQNGNPFGFPGLGARNFDLWQIGLNVSWELDIWGRFRRTVESADANVQASIEDYDDILVCLLAEVASTYVEYRAFEQRLETAHRNVEVQQDNLAMATTRFESGVASKLDVTQGQASLDLIRATIPPLQIGLRQANNRLCGLLGVPPHDLFAEAGTRSLPEPPANLVVSLPADLLRRRPDVRRAEREVAVQSARIGIAMADLFPRLTIDGTLNWQASDFADLFQSSSQGGTILPRINWNILNYARLANNVRIQDVRLQQAANNYQQAVINANVEAENAIVAFLRSHDQVESLRQGVESIQESLEAVRVLYQERETDFDRVNNLQRELALQQDNLVQAQANVAANCIAVYKNLGGGWQIRCGDTTQIPCVPMSNCKSKLCSKQGPCTCSASIHQLLEQ